MRDQSRFFVDLFAVLGLCGTMVWTYFETKKQFFCGPKNHQKTGPSKNMNFGGFCRFSGCCALDFHRFLVLKVVPGAHFSEGFSVIGSRRVF